MSLLHSAPIGLVPVDPGSRVRFAAAVVGMALFALWLHLAMPAMGAAGPGTRGLALALVGALLGKVAMERRALYRHVLRQFEMSPDVLCVTSFDGLLERVNPAFQKTLGHAPSEVLGRPFTAFVHPDDVEVTLTETSLLTSRPGHETVGFRNRCLAKDGTWRWLEWAASADEDDGLIYAVARDVSDRKTHEDRLAHLSRHDALTGLVNRTQFHEELARTIARAARYDSSAAVLLLDLDGFKEVNDTLGHQAGDAVLRDAAARLTALLRTTDVVGRLGGDEFTVLLP